MPPPVTPVDGGPFDAGPGGTLDGGPAADGGDAGIGADGGATDGGVSDGGTASAWCNGTHCYDSSGAVAFGTPGPWPTANLQFTAAQGIQEMPVVGVTTDEAQNLWVATNAALYLMKPGQTRFRRFAGGDGLHLQSNPLMFCGEYWDPTCRVGGAVDPGILEIVGGGPNEVFVGYMGAHQWDDPHDGDNMSPLRHTGKIDRVRLATDGTIIVDFLDLESGNDWHFFHNREVWKMLYDHVHHPHDLYVGTEHGVDRLTPDKFRYPTAGEWFNTVKLEWMSDHLHPRVCAGKYCTGQENQDTQLMGDWRGLAQGPDGDLWVAGRWGAGKIIWTPLNHGSLPDGTPIGWFERGGNPPPYNAFSFIFGDPWCGTGGKVVVGTDTTTTPPTTLYGPCPNPDGTPGTAAPGTGSPPIFRTNIEGDPVSLSAVTVTPDGLSWWASGVAYGATPNYGVARFNPRPAPGQPNMTYFDPVADLGAAEQNVTDMVALPDGRLVLGSPKTGLTVYNPATGLHVSLRGSSWLPGDGIRRLELDTMVNPPALHVSTDGGGATLRQIP